MIQKSSECGKHYLIFSLSNDEDKLPGNYDRNGQQQ